MEEFVPEGFIDAFEAIEHIEPEDIEDTGPTVEELDSIIKCPACGSPTKHTFREDPHGHFVWRKYFCRTVLDVDGLDVSKKCDQKVDRQEKRKNKKQEDIL